MSSTAVMTGILRNKIITVIILHVQIFKIVTSVVRTVPSMHNIKLNTRNELFRLSGLISGVRNEN